MEPGGGLQWQYYRVGYWWSTGLGELELQTVVLIPNGWVGL